MCIRDRYVSVCVNLTNVVVLFKSWNLRKYGDERKESCIDGTKTWGNQETGQGRDNAETGKKRIEIEKWCASRVTAVSYTHLDVYKRQILTYPQQLGN